jgi:hypothetical protein
VKKRSRSIAAFDRYAAQNCGKLTASVKERPSLLRCALYAAMTLGRLQGYAMAQKGIKP